MTITTLMKTKQKYDHFQSKNSSGLLKNCIGDIPHLARFNRKVIIRSFFCYYYIGITVLHRHHGCFGWSRIEERGRNISSMTNGDKNRDIAIKHFGSDQFSSVFGFPLYCHRQLPSLNFRNVLNSNTKSAVKMYPKHCYDHDKRLFGSSSSDDSDMKSDPMSLISALREAYQAGETDGILNIAPPLLQKYDAEELIMASAEAVKYKKGQTAGIINALIGSCCSNNNGTMAWNLLQSFDKLLSDQYQIYPDLVTLCNVYTSLTINSSNDERAEEVLKRAQKYSKKLAGSKRRKALVKARNKKSSRKEDEGDSPTAMAFLQELKSLYGLDFDILFEDDNLLVLSKPSGMVCYHKRKTTAGKIKTKKKKIKKNDHKKDDIIDAGATITNDISLEDALLDKGIPLSSLNPEAMGVVHRIDRGTSGCIVFTKNDMAHARLVTEFFLRNVKKSYVALTPNNMLKSHDNDMHSPTEMEELRRYTIKPNTTIDVDLPVNGRPALSKFTMLKSFKSNAMLLKVETFTGRKHQIRVHCAEGLKSPIFLDPLYNSIKPTKTDTAEENELLPDPIHPLMDGTGHRFFLHASTLAIPFYNVHVESPLPSFWNKVLKDLQQLE